MREIITVELGIAKHVFQVHGLDDQGLVVIRNVRRSELPARDLGNFDNAAGSARKKSPSSRCCRSSVHIILCETRPAMFAVRLPI